MHGEDLETRIALAADLQVALVDSQATYALPGQTIQVRTRVYNIGDAASSNAQSANRALDALRAFAWFLGSNDLSTPLVDLEDGSCCDGLHPDRSNDNRGGESLVSYLLALAEIRQLHRVGSIRLKTPLLRSLHADMPPAPATH